MRRAVLWVLPLLLGFAGPALALPPGNSPNGKWVDR